MRRIVAPLSAVLMLAAVTAMAQEKMKDPPKSSHEGMAKAGGAKSDAAVIAKATSAAPPDIGRNAAVMGMGAEGASNTDPYASKPTADNQWVVSGPHIMLLPTDVSQLDAYPTDWTKGGP